MGKRAGKFKPKHHGNKKVKGQWTNPTIPQENKMFKQYYELQLKLPQQEFQIFWNIMKEKLPVVFRVNPNSPNYSTFLEKIQHPLFLQSMVDQAEQQIIKQIHQPKQIPKLQLLPWYPGNILYQINTTKQIFKKSKVLNSLHQFLQKAFDAGLVARQQLVSMLPPLFLDVKQSDIVLDMCAAPGSKTSQLLQMMYGQKRHLAEGCVIANDADYSRAHMLIHQINRSGTANIVVVNHPGQFMPQLYTSKINHIKQKFQFDKILCDVPCSGDGATRKIPIKWAKWHTSDGVSLHPLQLSILMKSINLLKKGGLLVYSTCSLNPMENEAVLAGIMSKVASGLEILDIHGRYGIKGRRGLLKWDVCGIQSIQVMQENEKGQKVKKIKVFKSIEEVKNQQKYKQSMFSPDQQVSLKMQLHHSMRILPHDQNSGGFFVALLKKHENFEWKYNKNQNNSNQIDIQQQFVNNNLPQVQKQVFNQNQSNQNNNQSQGEQQQKPQIKQHKEGDKKNKKQGKQGKYQKFINLKQTQFQQLSQFFGLDPQLKQLLYVRQIDGITRKNVLLVSKGVRRFLDADRQSKIKLVNMGCKAFQKGKQSFAGHQCLYRLSQEGIHFLLPFITKRKVRINLQFLKSIINIHSLVHDDIKDNKIRQQIKTMSQGSFCLYIDKQINGRRVVDAVVGQNFKSSLHLMVGKQQLASLCLRYL